MTRLVLCTTVLLLAGALLGPAPRAYAQQAVDEPTTVVADSEGARRQAVLSVLDRVEVRRVATTAGLDLEAARANVRLLEGERLDRAARQARALERAQFGTISSTTLIILLLITILLIVVIES